jgi:hypothetical protein
MMVNKDLEAALARDEEAQCTGSPEPGWVTVTTPGAPSRSLKVVLAGGPSQPRDPTGPVKVVLAGGAHPTDPSPEKRESVRVKVVTIGGPHPTDPTPEKRGLVRVVVTGGPGQAPDGPPRLVKVVTIGGPSHPTDPTGFRYPSTEERGPVRPELDLNALRLRAVALEDACSTVLDWVEVLQRHAIHATDDAVETVTTGLGPVFAALAGPLDQARQHLEVLGARLEVQLRSAAAPEGYCYPTREEREGRERELWVEAAETVDIGPREIMVEEAETIPFSEFVYRPPQKAE